MRRIKIEVHPLSVVLGVACAVAVSFAASPAQLPVSALSPNVQRIALVGPVTVDGIYDPREAVVIKEDTPFIVPAGKLLVLTAIGRTAGESTSVALRIDGTTEVRTFDAPNEPAESSVRPLPDGLTANAGSTVEIDNGAAGSDGRAWGYLVDA